MRYLGIDYGTKKVGLALSDEAGLMGFPHNTHINTPKLIETVLALIDEKDVGAVVIGESKNNAGDHNVVARAAHAFGKVIEIRADVPVYFEPETYTTQEARRYPDGSRMEGSPDVDASAAALILSSYLTRNFPRADVGENTDV